jgi:hypothetical protein
MDRNSLGAPHYNNFSQFFVNLPPPPTVPSHLPLHNYHKITMSNSNAAAAVAYFVTATTVNRTPATTTANVNRTAAPTAAAVNDTAATAVNDPPCILGIDPNHKTLIQNTMHDGV